MQKVATPVYILMQVHTYKSEVKLYYVFLSVNETSLGIAHLAIKRSNSLCFQQKIVARLELIRFNLFIY